MTIGEIISQGEGLGLLGFSRNQLRAWMGELEWMMRRELWQTHENAPEFEPVGEDSPDGQILAAPEGFGRLYLHWLESRMDLYNNEIQRYNASVRLFNQAWQEYAAWYNRQYPPKGAGRFRMLMKNG